MAFRPVEPERHRRCHMFGQLALEPPAGAPVAGVVVVALPLELLPLEPLPLEADGVVVVALDELEPEVSLVCA
jgi:hypothetical protein